MKKVYFIGAGIGLDAHIEAARVALSIPDTIPIVCVSKVEDIPIEDRMQQISELISIKAPPILEFPEINWERPEKRKGHERQYKFHK